MDCKSCGNPLPNDAKFCSMCGQHATQEPRSSNALFCANCSKSFPPPARFCVTCGAPLKISSQNHHSGQKSPEMQQICIKCGTKLFPGSQFCDECGTPVRLVKAPPSYKLRLEDLTARCFLCGLPIPAEIILCPRCEIRLNCFRCGQPLGPGKTNNHSFCPNCGHRKVSKKLQERVAYFRSLPPASPDQILSYYE